MEAMLFAAVIGGTLMLGLLGGSMLQVREAELRVHEAELNAEAARITGKGALQG